MTTTSLDRASRAMLTCTRNPQTSQSVQTRNARVLWIKGHSASDSQASSRALICKLSRNLAQNDGTHHSLLTLFSPARYHAAGFLLPIRETLGFDLCRRGYNVKFSLRCWLYQKQVVFELIRPLPRALPADPILFPRDVRRVRGIAAAGYIHAELTRTLIAPAEAARRALRYGMAIMADIAFCHIVLVRECSPHYLRRNGELQEFHGNRLQIVSLDRRELWIYCAAECIDHARHGNTTSLLNSSNVTAGSAWGLWTA